MKRVFLTLAAAALAFPALETAHAGTDTSTMNVSATVEDSCTITANPLAFGTYDTVSGAELSGTSTVDVACTQDATATITLGQGDNPTASSTDSAPERQLSDATNNLLYDLFQDSGHSTVWGNTSETGNGYTASTSEEASITVYGAIQANQDVPASSYSDSVVATITF